MALHALMFFTLPAGRIWNSKRFQDCESSDLGYVEEKRVNQQELWSPINCFLFRAHADWSRVPSRGQCYASIGTGRARRILQLRHRTCRGFVPTTLPAVTPPKSVSLANTTHWRINGATPTETLRWRRSTLYNNSIVHSTRKKWRCDDQ